MKPFIKKHNQIIEPRIPISIARNNVEVEDPDDSYPNNEINNNTNNMFRNFNFSWDGMFLSLLWISTALLIVAVGFLCFEKKYTHRYTLSGGSSGVLKISKEIDWAEDEDIILDRTVTYSEAVRLVDSLNHTLK